MEVSSGVVVQSTVDAIMRDYNVKLNQLAEGIVNRDKALEGLNKTVEILKATAEVSSNIVADLKTRYPDDEAFLEKESVKEDVKSTDKEE